MYFGSGTWDQINRVLRWQEAEAKRRRRFEAHGLREEVIDQLMAENVDPELVDALMHYGATLRRQELMEPVIQRSSSAQD